jgi:hypothetical protein
MRAVEAERDRLRAAGEVNAEALRKCDELFHDIRGDWTDPRSECREGWRVIEEALAAWKEATK